MTWQTAKRNRLLEARRLVIWCFLQMGLRDEARKEFEIYAGFRPPDVEFIRALFDR